MTTLYKNEYILTFQKYPLNCLDLFVNLSNIINQDNAYEILNNIPIMLRKKTKEEIDILRYQIVSYNFVWCNYLLNNNIDINTTKLLLFNYLDYYYIDIVKINEIINNSPIAFEFMNYLMPASKTKRNIYYQFRQYKIKHFLSYEWAHYNTEHINKIFELLSYNYNEVEIIKHANSLSEEQLDFLKICRFGYIDIEKFNIKKLEFFNNSMVQPMININNFELNEKGEFVLDAIEK
jgi:hypothetical protein